MVARGDHARPLAQDREAPLAPRRRRAPRRRAGSRRRQFGCSSIVPGRFGCSVRPSTSSIGISASATGDRAVKRDRGIDDAARYRPACGVVAVADAGLAECAPQRGAILRALAALVAAASATRPSACARRDVGAVPPARNGRQVMRAWSSRPRRGATWPARGTTVRSRWNHSTSMPAMPALGEPLAKRRLTVPRSSPMTTARWRCDSSASSRSRSSTG